MQGAGRGGPLQLGGGVTAASNDPMLTALNVIAGEAEHNEAQGRLSQRTLAVLNEQNLFGLWIPRCFGGLEVGILESLEIFENLSRADGSTGWVLMACNAASGTAAAFLEQSAAQEVFAKGVAVIAGQGAPRGRAEISGGGYRLSGKWSYGSGLHHAQYIHTGAMVYSDGKPVEARTFIVPVHQAKILGNWDVVGLRATGSVDYEIEDVYVPAEFTHSPNTLRPLRGGDLYRMGIVGMTPLGHGAVALGVGRRILDELRALMTGGGARSSAVSDSNGEALQEGYGTAEAKLRAGRAFFYEIYADVEHTLKAGRDVTTRQFSLIRLALNHATAAAADVSSYAYRVAGGVSLRRGTLQRCVRDMMTATQHRIVSSFMLRECAREILGQAQGKIWTSRGLVDQPRVWPH